MAKFSKAAFEKSGFDKDTKGAPEGSAKDMARDKKQMPAFLRKGGGGAPPAFKKGGKR